MFQSLENYKKIFAGSGVYYRSDTCEGSGILVLKLSCQHLLLLLLLRTLWLWGSQTRRRWSSSVRNLTRPWEKAGLPKSTGWPTMWLKTIAPSSRTPTHTQRRGGREIAWEENGVPWRWGDGRSQFKKGTTSRYGPVSPPRSAPPLKLTIYDISAGEIVARFAQAHQLEGGGTPTLPPPMRSRPLHRRTTSPVLGVEDLPPPILILDGLWRGCGLTAALNCFDFTRARGTIWWRCLICCPETTRTTGSAS